ncbi:PA domain-containing protein [Ditylenchus destructor]|nr:PA domain-containing protein [Ditylenchus destructor]
MGVSVKGKIAIMRYHTEFRGGKVMQAQAHGAIAAILYSEIAQDGTTEEDVYPSKVWLPPNGVQRGSLMMADGDVLSPNKDTKTPVFNGNPLGLSLARSFADASVSPLNASVFSQIILNSYIAKLSFKMEPHKSKIPEMQDASNQLVKMTEKAKKKFVVHVDKITRANGATVHIGLDSSNIAITKLKLNSRAQRRWTFPSHRGPQEKAHEGK